MRWPDSKLTDYFANNTPAIKADDLNQIQTAINKLWGGQAGVSFYQLREDFDGVEIPGSGSDVYLGKFLFHRTSGTSLTDLTSTDGFGVLTITGSGGASAATVATVGFVHINTSDFYFSARVQITAIANVNSFAVGNGGELPRFRATSGLGNWEVSKDNGLGATAFYDSGVAVVNGQWVTLEAARIGGVLTYWINGTQVATQATAFPVGAWHPTISHDFSTDSTYLIDYFALGVQRP